VSIDAAGIVPPDGEIETILNGYLRFWPYESLNIMSRKAYKRHEGENSENHNSESILKTLEHLSINEMELAAKKKAEREEKLRLLKKGLNNF